MQSMALSDKEFIKLMEPACDGLPLDFAARLSLAISLKRIADYLAGSTHTEDVVQYAMRELNIRR
jgi:hypothetical protein